MHWKIPRCYDSHTHFLATGLVRKGLRLFDLSKPEEVARLKVEPHHFRGEWLVGFGWDHTKWPGQQFPTREILDQVFPDMPVAFSRADGHALWLNSRALEKAGYLNKLESEKPAPEGGVILRDVRGFPSGVFTEMAKIEVDLMIPAPTREQEILFFKESIQYFNSRGFTHLRDMSGCLPHWRILREMDLAGELTLYVEENFTCENLKDFERALQEAQEARLTATPHLRARGIKFFFDGSLGSQGAYLSQFYPGTMNKGLTLWDLKDVEVVLEKTWKSGFEVCVHTIGDEAAHLILETAGKLAESRGVRGPLNIEHAEVLRPETIAIMKKLDVVCHLQPCHWLTDRRWLRESLGGLYSYAFPWAALQKAGVPYQWGSDSPIEEASVANNWKALTESPAEGIAPLAGDLLVAHTHRESNWGPACESHFENGQLQKLIFDGRELTVSPAKSL